MCVNTPVSASEFDVGTALSHNILSHQTRYPPSAHMDEQIPKTLFTTLYNHLSAIDKDFLPDVTHLLLRNPKDRGPVLFRTLVGTSIVLSILLTVLELAPIFPAIWRRIHTRIFPNNPLVNAAPQPNQVVAVAAIDLHLVNSDLRRFRLLQLRHIARLLTIIAVAYLLVDTMVKSMQFVKEVWVYEKLGEPCSLSAQGAQCAMESVLKVTKW